MPPPSPSLSLQCEMEESSSQKLVWDGDAKAVQQCLTDIFTSVYTTCDIPENAIFGPCVLSHTSLYDSIAFIALKSTDKRTAPYIFRVSGSAFDLLIFVCFFKLQFSLNISVCFFCLVFFVLFIYFFFYLFFFYIFLIALSKSLLVMLFMLCSFN